MNRTKQEQAQIQNYAQQLINEARRKGELPDLFEEVSQLLIRFNQQKLESFFSNMSTENTGKKEILQLFQKDVSPTLSAFFDEIVLRADYALVYGSLAEVRYYSQATMGQYDMTVTTVVPLTASQKVALIEKTEKLLSLKVRQLYEVLKPEIIGGFIIDVNHRVIDASIRHQLQQIKIEIK